MEISTITAQPTIDSREIAQLCKKKHSDVCRDIRNMLEAMAEGGECKFASSYLSAQQKPVTCYRLPKRECLILISGYSVPLRTKIIDRWAELEHEAATALRYHGLPDFTDPIAAARAWADEKEKNAILTGEGVAMCFRDAASHLGYPEREMLSFLKAAKVLYKAGGFYRAYSRYACHFQQFLAEDGENAWQNCKVKASGLDFLRKKMKKMK